MKVGYLHLRPQQPPPRIAARPFRVVIVADSEVDETWRDRIAAWIIEAGCLYVVAWGVGCEAWHDSVDMANEIAFKPEHAPDGRLVMTTWHDKEPLSEALWYAGNCAFHPDIELDETVIVHVAEDDQCSSILRAYDESQILAE